MTKICEWSLVHTCYAAMLIFFFSVSFLLKGDNILNSHILELMILSDIAIMGKNFSVWHEHNLERITFENIFSKIPFNRHYFPESSPMTSKQKLASNAHDSLKETRTPNKLH